MEAIGTLTSGIAHDFNNILTAIIGFATLSKMDIKDELALKSDIDGILSSTEKAVGLIKNLLAFSRKHDFNPIPVNLNSIVLNTEKILSHILTENEKILVKVARTDLFISADPVHIDQILLNLTANARDAMTEGGILSFTLEEILIEGKAAYPHTVMSPGKYALLTASDSGIGMDEETINRIFEPFFTTKGTEKGTGLGMSIVYSIVKQHNGYIFVSSEQGKGSTFKIFFPLISKEQVTEIQSDSVIMPRGCETILIVEDDKTVRDLLRVILQDFGYQVIEASDGQEAIDLFSERKEEIDLVLLDAILPQKSGKAVYSFIEATKPGTKVLFSSGYTDEIVYKTGIIEQGVPSISKPASPSLLLNTIRKILDSDRK
jgi:CheY-like chemotaxis protein